MLAVVTSPLLKAAADKQTSVRRQLNLNMASQEAFVSREYFYAGGRYVDDEAGKGQHIFSGQMYVEKLTPDVTSPKPYPLVFIHGQAQTGTVSRPT
jgi:hypothetical protein